MIDVMEKAICRKIARTFELAAEECYHPVDFTIQWLNSDTCKYLYELNANEIAQSYYYQLNSLKMEMKRKKITIKHSTESYSDEMYWAGYFFTYMMYKEEMPGPEIVKKYEVDTILSCFDTLHTLSCDVAIEKCKEDFDNLEKVKGNIFG